MTAGRLSLALYAAFLLGYALFRAVPHAETAELNPHAEFAESGRSIIL